MTCSLSLRFFFFPACVFFFLSLWPPFTPTTVLFCSISRGMYPNRFSSMLLHLYLLSVGLSSHTRFVSTRRPCGIILMGYAAEQVTLQQMQALEAALATVDQHAANAVRGRFSREPQLLTALIGVNNQVNAPLLRSVFYAVYVYMRVACRQYFSCPAELLYMSMCYYLLSSLCSFLFFG